MAQSESDEWGADSHEADSDGDDDDDKSSEDVAAPVTVKREADAAPAAKRVKLEGAAAAPAPADDAASKLPPGRLAYFGGKMPKRERAPKMGAAAGGKGKGKGKARAASSDSEPSFIDDDDDDDDDSGAAGKKRRFPGKKAPKAEDSYGDDDDDLMDDDDDDDMEDDGDDILVTDPWLVKCRDLLLSATKALELPPNPLDHLIDLLGGADNVAEMTGRAGHMVKDRLSGKVCYVKRNAAAGVSLKALNVHERNAFMAGDKLVAIISEAASTGISLQADKRVANTRRRLHLTLELPWSADKAIQQFGRSHRSNQASAPIYRICVTDVGGERRFAASAAKRLQSLGALLKGDRRALGAGASLKSFDVENKAGSESLRRVYHDIMGMSDPMAGVHVPGGDLQRFRGLARPALVAVGLAKWGPAHKYGGSGAAGRSIDIEDKYKANVPRFLNRLLGLKVDEQAALYGYFADTFDAMVAKAKSEGKWDEGLISLRAESIKLLKDFPARIHTCPDSGAETHVVKVELDRGIPFASATKRFSEFKEAAEASGIAARAVQPENGFYRSNNLYGEQSNKKSLVICITEIWTGNTGRFRRRLFRVLKPNIGNTAAQWLDEIKNNYVQITEAQARAVARRATRRRCAVDAQPVPESSVLIPHTRAQAKPLWDFWFGRSLNTCSHGENCAARARGFPCSTGMRRSTEALIVGAVLPIWRCAPLPRAAAAAARVRADKPGVAPHCRFVEQVRKSKRDLRVVRCTTDCGSTFVGLHVEDDDQLQRIVGAVQALDAAPFAAASDEERTTATTTTT